MNRGTDSLGICLGASTIGFVRLHRNAHGVEIVAAQTRSHEGNPRRVLREMLGEFDNLPAIRVAATGRKFRHRLALSTISEPEALELAAAHALPSDHPYRVIIGAGGETFMVYHLDDDGRIQHIQTGNKCASGTGEFFLQQLGRMSVTLEDAGTMDLPETYHKVSGRCSVFCKSDCTHALNKGIPKPQVVAGLARMMSGKLVELLRKLPKNSVMLVGGCAGNQAMVHYLRQEIPDLHVPEEAPYFEALGSALWALENEARPVTDPEELFVRHGSSLSFLKPLSAFKSMVEFKHRPRGEANPGDTTILGLDVGSTTTKGVIVRRSDKAILAADYLRTNGDPVGASREVYRSLAKQITVPIVIEGLGVTGSGRRIAGLYAMTPGVINEIIAHATGAVHFDPEVDTIFEIGGQDAKYTYLTNGVPSDYAMNEACSAGTGSFLEESAKESLGLDVTAIGPTAYEAESPPNFNDQCAAFIGSDIKGAVQEGISVPDIVAGLVYSICMNYANRVKGNRPVGNKVFMQGGVCYNEAIPAAMAALTGKNVVVPPEPGLVGAFGVALELERRMEQGLIESAAFDLEELANREVVRLDPFVCNGGKEGCDLKCSIARIEIDGELFPFGGICNRYDNLLEGHTVDSTGLNLVVMRQRRVFRDMSPDDAGDTRPTIGMNRSLQVNTFFPFYNRLFAELGYRLILPDEPDPAGFDQQGAAFCFPVELAHGYAAELLAKNPDFVFLPHLAGLPKHNGNTNACTCVFVQGEPFYLRSAFPELDSDRTLTPFLDFSKGMQANFRALRQVGKTLGKSAKHVLAALNAAEVEQRRFEQDIQEMGLNALAEVEADPDTVAVVLFGRAYNTFVDEANKGIPPKFASRGIRIIPFDMIPYQDEKIDDDHHMFWGTGQQILKAARYVARRPQLFATYVTNFSCGPDSFLIGYFRDIMARKPSLTLELDSHTADAGIETRIEAFLDIVQRHRQLEEHRSTSDRTSHFTPATVEFHGRKGGIRTSSNEWLPLDHERVNIIIPSMGRLGTDILAKAFARTGLRTEVLPPADDEVLKLGRGHSSCKECLPLQTTIGSLLQYLERRPEGEVTAYFMASTDGPCRFGQYHVFSKKLIEKQRIPDLAVLSLTTANGYGGMGDRFAIAIWRGLVIGCLIDEIWATLMAAATDRDQALATLEQERQAILGVIHKDWRDIANQLESTADVLAAIPLKRPYDEIPKVSLVGEIYVRQDPISLQGIVERMADRGFIVRTSKTEEWLKYLDWLAAKGIEGEKSLGFWPRYFIKRYFDRAIVRRLEPCGLFHPEEYSIDPVIQAGSRFVSSNLGGEAVLTVGSSLHEILEPSCGVICIGPFGCMPTRVAESILNEKFTTTEKRALAGNGHGHIDPALLAGDRKLPFLAIETDGSAFPQVIEARLEAFCLQARRLHDRMLKAQRAGNTV